MGTTVGNVLISYDVNKLHTEVKSDLLKKGYNDHFNFRNQTKIYYLPNTTLWHFNKSSGQAMLDLKQVCSNRGVTLEKAISVKADEFVGL